MAGEYPRKKANPRNTEKFYAPWVRARQEQMEADVRRTWQTHEPQLGVHGAYTEMTRVYSLSNQEERMVEAGGVEPPSEKRYDTKPTCLAQFRLFRPPRSE
jgi:hypothetical protein